MNFDPNGVERKCFFSYTPTVDARQFQALFSREFRCPPSGYEERAFWELLHWHAKPVAGLVRKIRPRFFDEDFNFIRYLGEATNLREVKATAAEFQGTNIADRNFLRSRLKIRVSGRKASRLAHELFSKASQTIQT